MKYRKAFSASVLIAVALATAACGSSSTKTSPGAGNPGTPVTTVAPHGTTGGGGGPAF